MAKAQRYSINKNKYLSTHELEKLKDLLRTHLERDRRNCLLLLLALHTGARAQEILNLELGDLDPEHKSLFIQGIKGSNDREIPLPDFLFAELQTYTGGRRLEEEAKAGSGGNPDTRLFNISYNRFRQIWEHYRPAHKKLHSLRHTFAIELYRKTKDIRLVQVALGHRNIANTMVYADYVYSQSELRKLIL